MEIGHNPLRATQLGYAPLDTRDIARADGLDEKEAAAIIQGVCYLIEKRQSTHNSLFRFRETRRIGRDDIVPVLQELVLAISESADPRNVVLIDHNIKSDILTLKESTPRPLREVEPDMMESNSGDESILASFDP